MRKTVDIDSCGDCPHRYYENNFLRCDQAANIHISTDASIPRGCPLPDSKPYKYSSYAEYAKVNGPDEEEERVWDAAREREK